MTLQGEHLRGPCFHGFHRGCFATWYDWHQRDCERQIRECAQHTGNATLARQLEVWIE